MRGEATSLPGTEQAGTTEALQSLVHPAVAAKGLQEPPPAPGFSQECRTCPRGLQELGGWHKSNRHGDADGTLLCGAATQGTGQVKMGWWGGSWLQPPALAGCSQDHFSTGTTGKTKGVKGPSLVLGFPKTQMVHGHGTKPAREPSKPELSIPGSEPDGYIHIHFPRGTSLAV